MRSLDIGSRIKVNNRAATKYHGATGVIVRLPTQVLPQVKIRLDRPGQYDWGDGTGHAYFSWAELDIQGPQP